MNARALLERHWRAFAWCGALTATVGMASMVLRPLTWRAEAELSVRAPALTARLVNPSSAPVDADETLDGLEHRLRSSEQLVTLVKAAGLVEQLEAVQAPADRASSLLRGRTEAERLALTVDALRERLHVERAGRRLRVQLDWPGQGAALQVVRAEVDAVVSGALDPGLAVLTGAARATDDRLRQVRAANREYLAQLDGPTNEHAATALKQGLEGEAELVVRSNDLHLALDSARRGQAASIEVLRAPHVPRDSPPLATLSLVLLWAVVSLLSASAGPLIASRSAGLPPWLVAAALTLLSLASGIAIATSEGAWSTALDPLRWTLVLWLVWTLPLKWPFLALLLAAITTDDPSDRAYVSRWHSPLYDLGRELFTNVAWFTGFELWLLALGAVMWARRVRATRLDPLAHQAPKPMRHALFVSLATVAALVLLGLARGGEFRQALWQFRFLMMVPVVSLLALYALDFPRDLKALLVVLLVGSLVKSGLGIYFMEAIAPTLAHFPPHTSGHNDTMLLVTAVLVPLALLWERPTKARLVVLLCWVPVVALAIRYNDRRIAYVDLVACAVAIFLVSPRHRVKRFVMQGLVVLVPVVGLYLALGWNREHDRVFAMAQTVRSLVSPVEGSKTESSNVERDIENFNLIGSWKNHAVFGQGFGHAFTELLPSNDFSQSNFGHVGHNSLLWLLWLGGVVGFTGVLLYVGVALFFFARTLRRTRAPDERAALLVAMSILVIFLNQCFGDMGTQSIEIAFFVAVALAIIGRLATRHQAWLVPT